MHIPASSRTIARDRRARRRSAEHLRQRDEILDAALECFAAGGYEGTSMQEVADAAGFSVGHLYNLIGNKETLYDAVIAREGKELERALGDAIRRREARPAIERLDALIDASLAFFHHHRAFFRIHLNESRGQVLLPRAIRSRSGRRLERRLDRITLGLLEEAIEEGDVVELDPQDLLATMRDVMYGLIARWAVSGFRGDLRAKADTVRRILWGGMAVSSRFRRRLP